MISLFFCLLTFVCFSSSASVQQSSLNLADTKKTALLALASYCGNSRVNTSWSCYWCNQIPGFQFVGSWNNPTTDIFGYAGIRENTVYVLWRGTLLFNINNWVKNFDFKKVDYPGAPGAQVHHGFFSEYNSVRDAALKVIKSAINKCPNCRIMVSGHSLGGALSVLSALDVKKIANNNNTLLVALSNPRVGNMQFKNFAEQTLPMLRWRVVNHADVVPHVPPRAFGFEHIGGEAWLTPQGQWKFCADGENQTCSNSLTPFFNPVDHAGIMGLNPVNGVLAGCLIDANNNRKRDAEAHVIADANQAYLA